MANATRALAINEEIHPNAQLSERRGPFTVTPNGLRVDRDPTFAEWGAEGPRLSGYSRGMAFIVGDWLNLGEERFGEQAAQVIDPALGWTMSTLAVYRNLAKNVLPQDRRMDRLGVRHHLAVQTLSRDQQRTWLGRAAADDEDRAWTVKRLQEALDEASGIKLVTVYYLRIACKSREEQRRLLDRLAKDGLNVEAVERKSRPK